MTSILKRVPLTATLLAWCAYCLARMFLDARGDPGPTGLPGDLPNWHNRAGDLRSVVAMTLAELLVVLAIARPWAAGRLWKRTLLAALLFTPWLVLHGALILHAGSVMVTHLRWLAGTWAGLLAVSAVAVLVDYSRGDGSIKQAT